MRLRRIYGAPVAAVSMSVEGETAAYAAAVVANGGTVSDARVAILNTFIRAEKASGAWALTDDYWGLWAENETQALTSLKQRRLAAVIAAPTFTADRDYTFNGTTQYVNTGFIPSTHGINYKTTDQRVAVYERTNLNSVGVSLGVTVTTGNRVQIVARTSSTMGATANNSAVGISFVISPADSRGLKAVSRAGGGTTVKGYDRGVALTDVTGITAGVAIQNIALFIGALNNAGTAASFRASAAGFAAIGGPLSDAQEAAQYAAVQAWATAVGANV